MYLYSMEKGKRLQIYFDSKEQRDLFLEYLKTKIHPVLETAVVGRSLSDYCNASYNEEGNDVVIDDDYSSKLIWSKFMQITMDDEIYSSYIKESINNFEGNKKSAAQGGDFKYSKQHKISSFIIQSKENSLEIKTKNNQKNPKKSNARQKIKGIAIDENTLNNRQDIEGLASIDENTLNKMRQFKNKYGNHVKIKELINQYNEYLNQEQTSAFINDLNDYAKRVSEKQEERRIQNTINLIRNKPDDYSFVNDKDIIKGIARKEQDHIIFDNGNILRVDQYEASLRKNLETLKANRTQIKSEESLFAEQYPTLYCRLTAISNVYNKIKKDTTVLSDSNIEEIQKAIETCLKNGRVSYML